MPTSKSFLVYLAFLSMLGFLATDMYLPAYSAMEKDLLYADREKITMSMSVFLAGFACAQLLWGQLSDSLGRKIVLASGLTLSALACLGIIFINNVYYLLALRFIQGVGVCAAAVSWQALIIDRYNKDKVNRILATIMPLVALSPAIAPLIGSFILRHMSWQGIFIAIFVITALLIPATFYYCRKDHELNQNQQQKEPGHKIGFIKIITSGYYFGNVTIYAACSACFFAWLAGSPYILKDLGLSDSDIGLSYIPQTIAFLVGGYSCRFLLNHFSNKKLLPIFLILYSVSTSGVFFIAISGHATFVNIMIFFCGMAMMNGAIYPLVVGNALQPFPTASGRAAALQNTSQLGLCFIASQIVSTLIQNSLIATSSVMLSTIPLVLIGYIIQYKAGENWIK